MSTYVKVGGVMVSVATLIAAILAIGGGGGGGGGTLANLWVATSPGTGCTRSATAVVYNTATDCTLAAACTAASAGDTVRLQTGSYGQFLGCGKSTPGVTFAPASGASPTMRIDLASGDAWLIFDGIKFTGGHSAINGGATHITVKNAEIADELDLDGRGTDFSSSAIQIGPGLSFTMANDSDGSSLFFEGRLTIVRDNDGSTPSGILVTGNTFGPGGCADGIQANAGGWTVTNSTFTNLVQGSCDPHVDSIQFFAGNNGVYRNVTITNNLFHTNQSGVVDYDSQATDISITNDVFDTIPAPGINPCGAICLLSGQRTVIDHVTMKAAFIETRVNNQAGPCQSGMVLTNSIVADTPGTDCGSYTRNHNLCLAGTCTGTGSLSGAPAPTWVGGSSPTTFAGWALASGSRGENVASDGADIGVNP